MTDPKLKLPKSVLRPNRFQTEMSTEFGLFEPLGGEMAPNCAGRSLGSVQPRSVTGIVHHVNYGVLEATGEPVG